MAYLYDGYYSAIKKQGSTDTCNNIDDSQNN